MLYVYRPLLEFAVLLYTVRCTSVVCSTSVVNFFDVCFPVSFAFLLFGLLLLLIFCSSCVLLLCVRSMYVVTFCGF
jgi:hypothetical protein